jgi:crotonobetainyl-CoA:carnitine CoA-transferase CaiB-like acyl-CoA transferase
MPDNIAVAPLNGILILDFTRAVAGPFATMMLGDLGARVIKIEEPMRGDETRAWGPPFVRDQSAYFLSMNRNKESVAADLKSAGDVALVRAIAARADAVVENFRPGVMDRLGLGYAALREANRGLVYASVSGFGQTGPDRDKPGYDMIVQAMSGSMHVSATPEQGEVKIAFPVSDIAAALFTSNAILAALFERTRTGEGRYIEVSLLEAMLCAQSNLTGSILLADRDPPRVGNAQGNIVPYQLFRCSDAAIVCGALNEPMWGRFCKALGHEEWASDARFATNPDRTRHRAALIPLIEAVLGEDSASVWIGKLERHGIPCGPVLTLRQALELEQVSARGAIVEMESEKLGKIRMIGNPMRISGYEPAYRAPAALGEDTDRIRREFLP